jgi:predicted nucleotidyltransferase
MRFDINKLASPTKDKYIKEDFTLSYNFAKKLYTEFGDFLKAVILFGSTSRETHKGDKHDIDVLVVVDDVTVDFTPEMVQTYRVIVEKIIGETSRRLHVMSLKLTSFWEYVRQGDPVAINILRDGVALVDTGFFDPLQALLYKGRIRPSPESVHSYFARAPTTLTNSKWHLLQATIDLYWAVIDSAHAALMSVDVIPPTPDHVADLLQEKLVPKKAITQRDVATMRQFYNLSKMITHREIKEITGQQYDRYYREASHFVEKMRMFLEGKKK